MKMILKRYVYSSGLDIVAPLKCGTRWLEGFDTENRIDTFTFAVSELGNNVHSGTTFIWRPISDHVKSAIITELTLEPSLRKIIWNLESGECDHWYPHLYRELYPIWNRSGFRFWKLRNLSNLNPVANEMDFDSDSYLFKLPKEYANDTDVLNGISPKHTIRLNTMIVDEEKWLKPMIAKEYAGKNWEDYSDLEDSVLGWQCAARTAETKLR